MLTAIKLRIYPNAVQADKLAKSSVLARAVEVRSPTALAVG